MKKTNTPAKASKKGAGIVGIVLLCLLLLIGFLAFFSAKWYIDTYGQMGFDSILYTLLSDLTGVESDLIANFAYKSIIPAALCTVFAGFVLFYPLKQQLVLILFEKIRICLFPLRRSIACIFSLLLSAGLILQAAADTELLGYLRHLSQMSTIYQDEYRDPATTAVAFPEEKRNLIYIFLESMECTFFSKEQGGILETSAVPELYDLAEQHINFSHNDSVGGYYAVPGSTWTVGSMVSHTSGIPLKTPPEIGGNDYGADGTFLPGVTGITNILQNNGYYQALMVGSDANFGGRRQYFSTHGIDRIYDINDFWQDGIVENDRYVWWGAEDLYLFEYAKQELGKLAAKDQPFTFTLLTTDTHHVGGYVCEYCEDSYPEQYENVYACSSRQVNEFVSWLQAQDFYENTTVVIVGDHPSMDGGYIKRNAPEGYTRMVYNCILNSAVQTDDTKNRIFCAIDLFPTTLAALGCQIDGDRLALGTNLFSDVPTLAEKMGLEAFCNELGKNSAYYINNFFFNQ